MKAPKEDIIKAAEMGILRTLENFLAEPLKPGRLKKRFLFIRMIVDAELAKLFKKDKNFYVDNKEEITTYLNLLSDAVHWEKNETHIGSVISFCLSFLERSETKYPSELYQYLNDIIDYYERAGNLIFKDMFNGAEFDEHWKKIKEQGE